MTRQEAIETLQRNVATTREALAVLKATHPLRPEANPRRAERAPCAVASIVREPGRCNERAGYGWHRCAEQPSHEGDCRCACGERFAEAF